MEKTQTIIGNEFAEKVIPLIKRCKKSIDIVVYDWRWYPTQTGSAIQRFNNAIINASTKGKKVRAITNRAYIDPVLQKLNIKTKRLYTKKTIHTKLMIIDNEVAILGSHNYTMNAFAINFEISLITIEPETLARLKLYFENLWQ